MKKTKLTRSLLAACSIVALTAVMYGCVHDGGDGPTLSELDLTGYDTAAGVDVDADTYSTDGVPAALATALAPVIGYDKAAELAKLSLAEDRTLKELVLEQGLVAPAELDRILDFRAMTEPG